MKKLKCSDLGGPCEAEVCGETFAELGENCKAHVMEKINGGCSEHMQAATDMMAKSATEQQACFADYQRKFDEAPEC